MLYRPPNGSVKLTVDVHSLVHRKLTKAQRALAAADVLNGRTDLRHTRKLVAQIFDVSVPYVTAAKRLTEQERVAVANGWRPLIPRRLPSMPASPQQRLASIVNEIGVDVTLNLLATLANARADELVAA